jgi:hypothetical protein
VAGSQRRQAGGEGEVLVSLVGEVPRVALVLAVDEMEPDSAGGSLPSVKQPCGGSALWCFLTRQLEDGLRGSSSGRAWLGGSSVALLGEERCDASVSRPEQSG